MSKGFNMTHDEFVERLLKNQDKMTQDLILYRSVKFFLENKYENKDITVSVEPYEKDKNLSFIVLSKEDTVLETFEINVSCITDKVLDNDTREESWGVVNQKELNKILDLMEQAFPPNNIEDNSFKTIPDNNIEFIDVNLIDPNPEQIRENFDDVPKLAKNIKNNGLLQPVTIKKNGDRYTLVDGERRLRAHKLLGWQKIRAILVSESVDLDEVGLVGNFHRSNPNPVATAKKIVDIRLKIKQTNRWGSYRNVISEQKRLGLDLKSPFTSCKEIDDVIEIELGLSPYQQKSLVEILRQNDAIQDRIKNGELSISEGIVTINLDRSDLPKEFVRAVQEAERRQKIIEKVEKKAKDAGDPNAKFLRYFNPLEKLEKQIKVGMEYVNDIDEKTYNDVRVRVLDFCKFMIEQFDFQVDELIKD